MASPPQEPHGQTGEAGVTPEDWERLSTLQVLDLVCSKLEFMGFPAQEHLLLRRRVEELEEVQDHAREALEKLGEALEKLRKPALKVGTFLEWSAEETACVLVNGAEYLCQVDPSMDVASLEAGMRVTLNEAFALTGALGWDDQGPILAVLEAFEDGRLRLGQGQGAGDWVVKRAARLEKQVIKAGDEVRVDTAQRLAIECFGKRESLGHALAEIPETPWSAVGGQEEAVQGIRETVELPYVHGQWFERFQHPVSKGFLLYGPPGCGKTLLGRAAASNLRQQIREKEGVDRQDFFYHLKGPEILNMWLGESERQVRELFRQCREKAGEGHLAFLFIDEAESILGTRNGGRLSSSIVNTLVPMFCTEMDGLEALGGVVVILASNRADLIDPAILRPGRIDRKIRVKRPDEAGVEAIYRLYLGGGIPLESSSASMAQAIARSQFASSERNRFLEVTYRSGKRAFLYRKDLVSGALVESVVQRAKEAAIQRSIEADAESPLRLEDLEAALDQEYTENELFPPSDLTEDWLKLTDLDPGAVVKLSACKPEREANPHRANAI